MCFVEGCTLGAKGYAVTHCTPLKLCSPVDVRQQEGVGANGEIQFQNFGAPPQELCRSSARTRGQPLYGGAGRGFPCYFLRSQGWEAVKSRLATPAIGRFLLCAGINEQPHTPWLCISARRGFRIEDADGRVADRIEQARP